MNTYIEPKQHKHIIHSEITRLSTESIYSLKLKRTALLVLERCNRRTQSQRSALAQIIMRPRGYSQHSEDLHVVTPAAC